PRTVVRRGTETREPATALRPVPPRLEGVALEFGCSYAAGDLAGTGGPQPAGLWHQPRGQAHHRPAGGNRPAGGAGGAATGDRAAHTPRHQGVGAASVSARRTLR